MFRVDPKHQVATPFSLLWGSDTEEYSFLQLTRLVPIWMLQTWIEDPDEHRDGLRYLFVDLLQAIQITCETKWSRVCLDVLLPDSMNLSGRPLTSAVTEVWEAREAKRGVLCFEVTTQSGVYVIDGRGFKARRANRINLIWRSES